MKKSVLAIGIAIAVSVIGAGTASAQALTQGLQWAVTPSLWGTGMDGAVRLGAVGGEVGETLGDIELSGTVRLEAKGPVWTLRAAITAGGNEHDLETATGTLDADMFTAELVSGWQFSETAELIFGARYYDADAELDFASFGPGMGPATFGSDQSWVDPIVGIVYGGQLARYWNYTFRLDVGGFGLGSDLAVNLRTEFLYEFNDSVSLQLGYRAFDVDYDNNRFVYDILQQGPEVGLRFAF